MQITGTARTGLEQAEAKLEKAARRTAESTIRAGPVDSVSLSEQMVALVEAKIAYEANLKVLQTAQEVERKALDILA